MLNGLMLLKRILGNNTINLITHVFVVKTVKKSITKRELLTESVYNVVQI